MTKNKIEHSNQLSQENSWMKSFTGILPVLMLFLIGLLKSNSISYHQKVFKTFLILIMCIVSLLVFFWKYRREKKVNFHIISFYLLIFFFFYLMQYFVSFFSGEVSYDREYYLANYGFLFLFSMFTYLFFSSENDLVHLFKILPIFMLILFSVSLSDFLDYVHYPEYISEKSYQDIILRNSDSQEQQLFHSFYVQKGKSYQLSVSLTKENKFVIRSLLSNCGYYRTVNYAALLAEFRPALSFGNTNYFAAYLIGLLPLSILSIFVLYDRKKKIRGNWYAIFSGIAAVLGFIPLILTQTTSAFLGVYLTVVFVVLPALILTSSKLKRSIKFILIFSCLLFFVVLPILLFLFAPQMLESILPRLVKKLNSPIFALKDRINGWTPAIELFKLHPLFGAGLGTIYPASFQYISKYFYLYSNSNSFKHAHNEFIEVLGEGGIWGLAFFLFLIVFFLFQLFRIFLDKEQKRIYRFTALGVLSGVFAILIQQLFDLSLRMSVTMAAFFTLIGIGIFLIARCTEFPFFRKIVSFPLPIFYFFVFFFLIIGCLLFRPLFLCEYTLMKSFRTTSLRGQEAYLDRSLQFMPGNPYALTCRYSFHSKLMRSVIDQWCTLQEKEEKSSSDEKEAEDLEQLIQEFSAKTLKDLSSIQIAIADYQDVWSKYASAWIDYMKYLSVKLRVTGDVRYKEEIKQKKKLILESLEKSLNKNFLNQTNHTTRIHLLSELGTLEAMENAVKEYLEMRLLLYYAKGKRIIKENIKIQFNDEPSVVNAAAGKYYSFSINNQIVRDAARKLLENPEKIKQLLSALTTPLLSD